MVPFTCTRNGRARKMPFSQSKSHRNGSIYFMNNSIKFNCIDCTKKMPFSATQV